MPLAITFLTEIVTLHLFRQHILTLTTKSMFYFNFTALLSFNLKSIFSSKALSDIMNILFALQMIITILMAHGKALQKSSGRVLLSLNVVFLKDRRTCISHHHTEPITLLNKSIAPML